MCYYSFPSEPGPALQCPFFHWGSILIANGGLIPTRTPPTPTFLESTKMLNLVTFCLPHPQGQAPSSQSYFLCSNLGLYGFPLCLISLSASFTALLPLQNYIIFSYRTATGFPCRILQPHTCSFSLSACFCDPFNFVGAALA